MTRQEAVDRLCDVYASSYDVTRCDENEHSLAATMDFYATAEKYVLSKKAKLWEANSFEYVYLFNVPHLTKEIYEKCEKLAYEQGTVRLRQLRRGCPQGAEKVPAVQELQDVLLGLDGFPHRAGGAAGGKDQHQRQRPLCSTGSRKRPVS